jgi:N-methylhydantoinase A
MYSEVSALVSRFGVDPREFSLIAFGGAGPMLACFLARELRMKEVVVPPTPGVLSALGGLIADLKSDFIQTIYIDLKAGAAQVIQDEFARLRERAVAWLRHDQGYGGDYSLTYSAEMRYRGQSFEVDTLLDPAAIEQGDLAALARAFHTEHERLYGHADPKAAIQVISLRLVIAGKTAKPEFPKRELQHAAAPREREIEVYLDGAQRRIDLYQRNALKPGHILLGPAVVVQDDCTTTIPPDFSATVDAYGNLRISAGGIQ